MSLRAVNHSSSELRAARYCSQAQHQYHRIAGIVSGTALAITNKFQTQFRAQYSPGTIPSGQFKYSQLCFEGKQNLVWTWLFHASWSRVHLVYRDSCFRKIQDVSNENQTLLTVVLCVPIMQILIFCKCSFLFCDV